jgi:single-stranded-DNA-specific exonuclease
MRWNPKSKPNPEKVQAIQQALQVDEIIANFISSTRN